MNHSKLSESISHALAGLKHIFSSERNIRIQSIVAIIAVGLGAAFRLTEVEWLFLSSAIFRVVGHETLNTAVERLSDMVESREDFDIKHIKDMSAAFVLLSAIYSLTVGAIIFLPKIIQYITHL